MSNPREGDIVHVNHPVPTRQAHGAGSRTTLVQTVTPIRLRHADASEFEEAAVYDRGSGYDERILHAHEGALWMRPDPHAEHRDAEGLLRLLQDPGEALSWYFTSTFLRSPLVAFRPNGQARGEAARPGRGRRVLHDGTDRARTDLKAFLDGNIRIVGEEVMVRCRGPLATHTSFQLTPAFMPHMGGLQHSASSFWQSEHMFSPRIDRVDAFWEFEKRFHAEAGTGKVRSRIATRPAEMDWMGLQGLDPALFADDDVLDFVNDAPRLVLRAAGEPGRAPAGIQALAGRLLPWRDLGDVGAVRPDEAEEVAFLVVDLAEELQRVHGAEQVPLTVRKIGRYGREMILPAIRKDPEPEAILEEDVAAFGAMRP